VATVAAGVGRATIDVVAGAVLLALGGIFAQSFLWLRMYRELVFERGERVHRLTRRMLSPVSVAVAVVTAVAATLGAIAVGDSDHRIRIASLDGRTASLLLALAAIVLAAAACGAGLRRVGGTGGELT